MCSVMQEGVVKGEGYQNSVISREERRMFKFGNRVCRSMEKGGGGWK